MNALRPLRIGFICTHSLTLATLYKGLFPYLTAQGHEVEAIVGDREYTSFDTAHFGSLPVHVVPMGRMPHPLRDASALWRMIALLRRRRYDVLHVSTPKAALIGSIAGKLLGLPVVFVYRRCVYEMMGGMQRAFFKQNDRIVAALSNRVVPISRQLRDYLHDSGLVPAHKLTLIGSGSSNGIDVRRFHPGRIPGTVTAALRAELGVPEAAPVLLFIGRVCSEKGVDLLPLVLAQVRARHPGAVMVVAGPDDARDPAAPETLAAFAGDPGFRRIGFVEDPAPLYALADIFVFPSFFEGFGNVLLEAAAHARAAVGFDVPGVAEAIDHRVSGMLVPVRDVRAMVDAVVALLDDPAARLAMAQRARARVERHFASEVIWGELDRLLRELAAPRAGHRRTALAHRADPASA